MIYSKCQCTQNVSCSFGHQSEQQNIAGIHDTLIVRDSDIVVGFIKKSGVVRTSFRNRDLMSVADDAFNSRAGNCSTSYYANSHVDLAYDCPGADLRTYHSIRHSGLGPGNTQD